MSEFQKILQKCGDFHRQQFLILGLFCLVNLLSAMHYYSQTIISFVPDYWCSDGLPEDMSILTLNRWLHHGNLMGTCSPLNISSLNISKAMPATKNSNDQSTNQSVALTCQRYDYELYKGYQSITTDLNWICADAWKSSLCQSMFFVGAVIGTLIFGILADCYGRLPVLVGANTVAMLGNVLTTFGTNLPLFCLFRFISGLATDSNFLMMHTLVFEYLRPSLRTKLINICIGVFYCAGSMMAPWIAVLTHTWRHYLLATALPLALVPLFFFVLPESAEWLVSMQKYERAIMCLQKVAKINGHYIDERDFVEFINERRRKQGNPLVVPSVLSLMKTPRLRRNTLILFLKSMLVTLCYDAVSRNVQGVGISPFAMFTLSASAILPACLLLNVLQDRFGRLATSSLSLLWAGVFILITGLLLVTMHHQSTEFVVILSILARLGLTMAYNSAAQYTIEFIPSCVRCRGVALVHVMGYAFTIFSSWILYTRTVFAPMPEIILGIISLFGAGICLLLPETFERTLPNSLEDGENFGLTDRWFSFSFIGKRNQSADALEIPGDEKTVQSPQNCSEYF